jgi:hypothetical protein
MIMSQVNTCIFCYYINKLDSHSDSKQEISGAQYSLSSPPMPSSDLYAKENNMGSLKLDTERILDRKQTRKVIPRNDFLRFEFPNVISLTNTILVVGISEIGRNDCCEEDN